jgi:hypothetical protein
MPGLLRTDNYGTGGWIPLLSYVPSTNSDGGSSILRTPISLIGDVNISQLWQDGVKASDFLYSDTGFAAMPNGTTLYAGQIIAPPAYWSGANGKRYAVDVVYQTGTTGTPNSGATTCTGTAATSLLTCTSATDLSAGQRISIGTDTNKTISYVDATSSSAVVVHLGSNLASTYSTATALNFSIPVLGPEIQMPTKSSAAPTTLAWSQGDMEQNSGATANGVAAWVNVSAGTPGTWAGVPLGNSSGQIAASQIASSSLQGTDTKVLTAGTVSGSGQQLCTDANGGATTSGCTVVGTSAPLWLQYVGTGADGSYEATAASCTAAAPCLVSGEKYYTSFTVDSGAYVYSNAGNASYAGLVIHSQGACNVYGTILVNGAKSTWTGAALGGGSAGGSGGGTAAGSAGNGTYMTMWQVNAGTPNFPSGGSAGTASGGAGSNGSTPSATYQRVLTNSSGMGMDGLNLTGAQGKQGGSTGGAGGYGGQAIVMMCGSINGTGGLIDVSGANGSPASANSTGSGSGGGGGLAILSSEAAVSTWPTVSVAGGPGALATVPQALATGGACTTQPKATLGVTSGALNGSCTVVQAGSGCGTGAGITWNVVGGGGTLGTGTVNPTWSSGALASCTTTAGTSSGYTAATYTTSGAGGDGGNGWIAEFAGW